MNKQNFEAQDRFPLSTQALTFMQDMIMATARLALIGGENYILSGCITTGNNVSDGIIVINGEVMPFKGGTLVDTITIVEDTFSVSANGLTFEKARVKRYAKFATGTGENYYLWSDFKSLQTNKQLEEVKATVKYVDEAIAGIQAGIIPAGVIVMWGGLEADIPHGWVLCDGREIAPKVFVPNLSGRFVVGFNRFDKDYDTIRKTGGAKEVALKPEQLPPHSHLVHDYYFAENKVRVDHGVSGYEYFANEMYGSSSNDRDNHHMYYKDHNTENFGNGQTHENRPPYYVLAFIIKIDVKQ